MNNDVQTTTPLITKQGVRNLNGPRMDGHDHNGRKSVSCAHYSNPHLPTYVQEKVMLVTRLVRDDLGNERPDTRERIVRCHHCSLCSEMRYTSEDEE